MARTVIEGVTVVPGSGVPAIPGATVVVDGAGIVEEMVATGEPDGGLLLVPAAVDLHLDNLRERCRPRATVQLDQAGVVAMLDTECAAAGTGVVCIAARCEDAPAKGVTLAGAVELAAAVEDLAPTLACDWRVHARVEVSDDRAIEALRQVLAVSSRVALVSVMEHSADRTRFASVDEHRRFYAEDWGVPLEQVDQLLAARRAGSATADDRRRHASALVADASLSLASHDDRTPDDVDAAFELGARVAEFPLSLAAARRARELGMCTVLGAPNVVRGRSTSPGNLLATEAVAAGVCDALCSDYLPAALLGAPLALHAGGVLDISLGIDLVASRPAQTLGIDAPAIAVGRPLTAALRRTVGRTAAGPIDLGLALWRDGRLVFSRTDAPTSVRQWQ